MEACCGREPNYGFNRGGGSGLTVLTVNQL